MTTLRARWDLSNLYWRATARYFLHYPGQLLLAIVGIATGVAAIVAIDTARTAIQRSFETSLNTIAGRATHRIVAIDGTLSHLDYVNLRRQFGAVPMAPVISEQATTGSGTAIEILGIDLVKERQIRPHFGAWLDQDDLDWAAWFGGADVALVDTQVPADLLRLSLAGRAYDVVVLGILSSDRGSGAPSLVLADLATVQRWSGRDDQIDYVDTLLDEASGARLSKALPLHLSLQRIQRQAEITGLSHAFQLNLFAMGLLAMLVGGFIVFNTLRFLVLQRQHVFVLQRVLGLSLAHLTRAVLVEGVAIAIIGALLGVGLGWLLADTVLAHMARTADDLYQARPPSSVAFSVLSAFRAGLLALFVGLVAALWPARQMAASARLTSAGNLNSEPPHRYGYWVGLGMVAAVAGVAALLYGRSLSLGLLGLFALAVGYVMASAPLTLLLARWRPTTRTALVGYGLSRIPFTLNRTAAAQAALILALAAVIGVAAMIDGFRLSVADWLDFSLNADFYLSATRDGEALDTSLVTALAKAPEIARIAPFRRRMVDTDRGEVVLSAQAPSPVTRASFRFLAALPTVWEAFERGQAVLISEAWATRKSVFLGDTITLITPSGRREFPVAGMYREYRTEGGRLLMHLATYRRLWRDVDTTSLGLYRHPAATEEALHNRLNALTQGRQQKTRFAATAEIRRQTLAIFDQTFALTRSLQWLAATIAFVGVFGALLSLQLERSKELQLLRSLGINRRELASLQLGESLFLGLVAALLAVPLGAALAHALARVINVRAFGWSIAPDLSVQQMAFALALGLAGALLAGLYPAWRLWHAKVVA